MSSTTIRAYERADLPLTQRLASLARRFPCLEHARGIDPFDPNELHAWAVAQGSESAAFHAAALLCNLWGDGPWERFDVLNATRVFSDQEKQMFVNWMLSWRF
jgi:hypothetical protein